MARRTRLEAVIHFRTKWLLSTSLHKEFVIVQLVQLYQTGPLKRARTCLVCSIVIDACIPPNIS